VARASQLGAAVGPLPESLKAALADAPAIPVDPKDIGPSKWANRHELSLQVSDPEFATLVRSFRTNGQDIPCVARPAPAGAAFRYEIAVGHRRHAACLLLNAELESGFPCYVKVVPLADREMAKLMNRENSDRKALSPYEQGRYFTRLLEDQVFVDREDLAKEMDLEAPTVFKYLQVAKLPGAILAAFGDPRCISLRWVEEINRALRKNEAAVLAAAERLSVTPDVKEPQRTLRALVAASGIVVAKSSTREERIKVSGRLGAKVKKESRGISVAWGDTLDAATVKTLNEELFEWCDQRLKKVLGVQ